MRIMMNKFNSNILNIIFLIFLVYSLFPSCKRKIEIIQVKHLLLNSENYFDHNIFLSGSVKEVGPLDLWFVLEDSTGYIQVMTQNIPNKATCLKKGQQVLAFGQLEQYSVHKYFSLQKNLECL